MLGWISLMSELIHGLDLAGLGKDTRFGDAICWDAGKQG